MAQSARLAISAVLLSLVLLWTLTVRGVGTKAQNLQSLEGVTHAQARIPPAAETMAAPTPTSTPPLQPTSTSRPSITYLTCDPCLVEPGGPVTLHWDLSGATAAYLDGQGVTAPGSTVVYPDQTTTYRLVAIGDNGQSEKTVTVEVRGLPTIHYFTCLPCEIAKGEQSTLSWDLNGATAAYLGGNGVPAPGNTVVAPDQTTTYRLEAVGELGSVERLVTVTVKEGGDPETVSEALRHSGYDVRWVGFLPLAEPLAEGGDTIGVIMAAAADDLRSQEFADQYFEGLKALYNNYPGQVLTVGLYDGVRHILFVTAESGSFEAFLRGEMDGQVFWQAATWNVWDDWVGRWLEIDDLSFAHQDFLSKSFGF
jgi:hypothetical protein